MFQINNLSTQENPYGDLYNGLYCSKGHWEGIGEGEEPKIDMWAFCKDYKEIHNNIMHPTKLPAAVKCESGRNDRLAGDE